jgi:hypothetical protein
MTIKYFHLHKIAWSNIASSKVLFELLSMITVHYMVFGFKLFRLNFIQMQFISSNPCDCRRARVCRCLFYWCVSLHKLNSMGRPINDSNVLSRNGRFDIFSLIFISSWYDILAFRLPYVRPVISKNINLYARVALLCNFILSYLEKLLSPAARTSAHQEPLSVSFNTGNEDHISIALDSQKRHNDEMIQQRERQLVIVLLRPSFVILFDVTLKSCL